jgi:hypothetical protein
LGVGLGAVGVGTVGLLSSALPPVLIGTAVLGAGVPWFVVGWSTGLQRYTPARLQGRVNATANMILNVPQTASIGLGATLIAVVDYRILLMVICVVMVTCGLVALLRPAAAEAVNPQASAVPATPVG